MPELEILVSGEVHNHESPPSSPRTAPVLSQKGGERQNRPSGADIKISQSLEFCRSDIGGDPVELGDLHVLWPVSDNDGVSAIFPGKLEPVGGETYIQDNLA